MNDDLWLILDTGVCPRCQAACVEDQMPVHLDGCTYVAELDLKLDALIARLDAGKGLYDD